MCRRDLRLLVRSDSISKPIYHPSSKKENNDPTNDHPSITWGILQERITTTNYGTAASPEKFTSPVVVNTVQSIFAATLGYIYLLYTRSRDSRAFPIFPTREILLPMLMVALTSSLASPFGYASLKYVDYITFTLAKSCKLLPVMFLHVVLFGKRYPWHKYVVVLLVTAGVAVFTLHHPSTAKKTSSSSSGSNSSILGLTLLAINLLFDGLTNTTQDHIYKAFRPYTGQQMMCGLNIMATVLTTTYLMFEPFLAVTDVGAFFGMKGGKGELSRALEFVGRHPGVGWDVLGFAACGALGQVFICESFPSVPFFFLLLLLTSSTPVVLFPCSLETKTDVENSLHPLDLRLLTPSNGNSDSQNADHVNLGVLVRTPTLEYAVAWSRTRVWWRGCRGTVE